MNKFFLKSYHGRCTIACLVPFIISFGKSDFKKNHPAAAVTPAFPDSIPSFVLAGRRHNNQLSFRAEMQRTQLRNYRDNKIQRLECIIKPPHPHFFNKKAVTVPSLYNYRSLHYDIFAKGYYNSFIIFCISFMYPGISNP